MIQIEQVIERLKRFQRFETLSTIERDVLLEDLRKVYREIEQINVSEMPKPAAAVEKPVEVEEIQDTDEATKKMMPLSEPETILIRQNSSAKAKDLNQLFTERKGDDLNEQFKSREPRETQSAKRLPISQLIDLNTRIFLKNELCQNREDVILHLLKKLDEMSSLASALDYIHDEWSNGHSAEAVDRLRALIRQKFGLASE